MLTADDLNKAVQGRRFERLAQAALRAHPSEYGRERFCGGWLWSEWPGRVKLGYGQDIVAASPRPTAAGCVPSDVSSTGVKVPTGGVDKFLAALGRPILRPECWCRPPGF